MAKILFTWEIGEGSGHIAPYVNLIKILAAEGHTVYFAVKSLGNAQSLLKDVNVIYLQAPILKTRPNDLIRPVNSYTKILNNSGFARVMELAGTIKAWQNLYDLIKPDLIIFNYSPTAMLASRELPIKRLQIGTGFHSPTDTYPIIGLSQLQGTSQDINELMAFENAMVNRINQALELTKIKPITKLADIQATDKSILLTFKELDHYPSRANADYFGMFKAASGLKPDWPNVPGPKVFMYLKPFPTLPQFLKILNEKKFPTLIYPDGISNAIIKEFTSNTLRFVDKPLDMDTIGKTADVAVCNGNHGTVCELLLSGIPMLLLPLQAEQTIGAINVQRLGAGLSAPQKHPETMAIKLDALINIPDYRKAAQAFAQRYAGQNNDDLNAKVLNIINTLLNS